MPTNAGVVPLPCPAMAALQITRTAIGERIREAREGIGLSQEKFAMLVRIGRNQFAAWEKGENACPSDKLALIGQVAGFDANYLLYGVGEPQLDDGRTAEERLEIAIESSGQALIDEIRAAIGEEEPEAKSQPQVRRRRAAS